MRTLSCHEGDPGHHYQITLSQDFKIAKTRQIMWTGFKEGWGLYSESLGDYTNPYDEIGYLKYDLERAVRLVVDTGIHFYGWDYDKSYRFMENIFPEHPKDSILSSICRYTCIPGQALSYKIGELVINKLRSDIVEKGGVSLVEFHQQLMKLGPVPLPLMEGYIHELNSSD
jgi:uncharacterized protein (DUF885 family)